MGNTASSEQPARVPQKLAKPRVGHDAIFDSAAFDRPPPTPSVSSPTVARLSTLYLAGSSADTTSESVEPPVKSAAEQEAAEADDGLPTPPARRESGSMWPTSPRLRSAGSRRARPGSIVTGSPDGGPGPSLVASRGEQSPLSPLSPLSPRATADTQSPGRDSQLDLSPGASSFVTTPSDADSQPASPVAGSSTPGAFTDPWRHDSRQNHTMASLLYRTQSEASIYAPTRRRSATRTPGIATRSPSRDATPSSGRPSFRQSLPADTGSRSRCSPSGSPTRRRISLPPPSLHLDAPPERVVTPEETRYRQLGAIKFGSLHITNGSPVTSPEDTEAEASDDGAYFGREHSATGDIKQPVPLSAAVSSAVATLGEGALETTASAHQNSSVSRSKPATNEPPVQGGARGGGTNGTTTPPDESQAKPATDLGRSDSGVGSSSSGSSQAPTSNADSGYSSSLSLKSFFGSRRLSRQSTGAGLLSSGRDADPPSLERPSPKQRGACSPEEGDDSRHRPARAVSGDGAEHTDQNNLSRSISSRGSLFRTLSSRKLVPHTNRARHARGSSDPQGSSKASTPGKSAPPTGAGSGGGKPKKLQKLLGSARRRSLPNMRSSLDDGGDVPSMPADAAEKLQEHSRTLGDAPRPSTARTAPKEPDRSEAVRIRGGEVADRSPVGKVKAAMLPRGPTEATGSARATISRSMSVLTPGTMSRPRPILRRPKTPKGKRDSSPTADVLEDCVLEYDVQIDNVPSMQKTGGNSAFDQAFFSMAEKTDIAMAESRRIRRPPVPGNYGPGAGGLYPRLRTRSSAPDFLETVSEPAGPGSVDCYSQKTPRTPPPVSIRTRGSRKKKRQRPPHAPSHGARSTQLAAHPSVPVQDGHGAQTRNPNQPWPTRSSNFSLPHATSTAGYGRYEVDPGPQAGYGGKYSPMAWPLYAGPQRTARQHPQTPVRTNSTSSRNAVPRSGAVGIPDSKAHAVSYGYGHGAYGSPVFRGASVRG